jgi:2-octaprenyl-6-methoxyphenol hydroxylase
MDDMAFASALEAQLKGLLGSITAVEPRGRFPLTWMQAASTAARRVMLVGEAAHVMPPIGAQGLNLGFRDVGCLIDCVVDAVEAGRDPGGAETVAAYNKSRAADIGMRMTAVDALNRSLLSDLMPVHLARGVGLHVLAAFGPLRRRIMSEGMQPSGSLPRLMRAG